jgi:hypothetical protein
MSLAIIVALMAPGAADAKATNDLYRSATNVSALPFSETRSTATATIESGEPAACGQPNNSVWYTYTAPTDRVIRVTTVGSSYDALVMAYVVSGHGFAGLTPIGCQRKSLQLAAGTTYAIQVFDGHPLGGGGNLVIAIDHVMPPANDQFASATPVASLPYTDRVDLTAATLEAGEPDAATCVSFPPLIASAWYAFSPSTEGHLQVFLDAGFENSAAVYSGSSLGALTLLSCGFRSIAVHPGTTYFIQAAAESLGKGPADLIMRQTASPEPTFVTDPAEPNSIEPTAFYNVTSDPGGQFFTDTWTFHDGSTSVGSGATYQYAVDGDYLVGLTMLTDDGRTGSTQQTVSVRTHDVSVVGITAPRTARSGQTRTVSVSVVDRRYPETAAVRLYRLDESGQTLIDSIFLDLLVSSRPTTAAFPYTFTTADAAVGKVTFVAGIEILGHTDALPADNTRTAETSVAR